MADKGNSMSSVVARFKKGEATVKELLDVPDDEIESTYSVSLQLLKMEKFQTAAQVLSSLTVLNPYDIRFWRAMALAVLKTNRPKLAITLCHAALALDEGDLPSRLYRAEAAISANRMDVANADLKFVAASTSKDPKMLPFVTRAQTLLRFLAAR